MQSCVVVVCVVVEPRGTSEFNSCRLAYTDSYIFCAVRMFCTLLWRWNLLLGMCVFFVYVMISKGRKLFIAFSFL